MYGNMISYPTVDGMTTYSISGVDINGRPVERSKQDYPYSYSSYVVYRNGTNEETNGSAYTDRIWQWDHDLSTRLWEKHAGKRVSPHDLSRVSPKVMEAFLRERFDHPKLTIVVMMDGCNQSSGYEVGYVSWKTNEDI